MSTTALLYPLAICPLMGHPSLPRTGWPRALHHTSRFPCLSHSSQRELQNPDLGTRPSGSPPGDTPFCPLAWSPLPLPSLPLLPCSSRRKPEATPPTAICLCPQPCPSLGGGPRLWPKASSILESRGPAQTRPPVKGGPSCPPAPVPAGRPREEEGRERLQSGECGSPCFAQEQPRAGEPFREDTIHAWAGTFLP